MSIQFTAGAPADLDAKVQLWGGGNQLSPARALSAETALSLGTPYIVRYLSVQNVADGALLDAVQCSRWRLPILDAGNTSGELELDEAELPIAFHEGPGKDGVMAAVTAAESLAGDFEACVLEAAPLRFIALWLQSKAANWIVPFAPNQTALTNYKPVSTAEALAVLQPMAKAILEAQQQQPGDSGG